MWWIALLPDPSPESASATDLAWWALRFTPRVARLEEAVLLEVQASLRLFGGGPALLRQLLQGVQGLGVSRIGVAPGAMAALALARSLPQGSRRVRRCSAQALAGWLDSLPLAVLSEADRQRESLWRMGCRTLGQLRALPRGGLSRRLGAGLLLALDQVYGQQPETFDWERLPERFEQTLQCASPIERSQGLMWGAQRLLRQLALWLAARQAGVRAVVLRWQHDARRGCAAGGEIEVRSAEARADMAHLERLLAEQLARVVLPSPEQALSLQATAIEPWTPGSASLLPQDQRAGESLGCCLERLAARLGSERVLVGRLQADHRPQHRQRWLAVCDPAQAGARAGMPPLPVGASQPAWLLDEPLALALVGDRPYYHGPLSLLAGPERIEAGWWDGSEQAEADLTLRDYFIARSPGAGLLWVFRLRGGSKAPARRAHWFLHGVFG